MDTLKISIVSLLVAFIIVWLVMPRVLPILHRLHFGQAIREEGPQSHMKKSGTPTMGGLVIQGAVLIAVIIISLFTKKWDFFPLIVMVAFGAIGFIDDFIKVSKKHNLGLRAWQKLVLQFAAALAIAIYAAWTPAIGTELVVPFMGTTVDFGIWYVPFTFFAVVAVTNAVNLTDGLDGLASGVTAIVCLFFLAMAVALNQVSTAVFSGAVIGACLGFLRYNSNPAEIFMGDTGSMALGGAVIVMAIITRMQIFVLIAGLLYVIEALSVVIQVGYFKLTHGKRFFKMAPIHHHFELKGWSETRVVTVFWIVTAVFVALAFLCL
ncbi:phospho-N-acetylmuramoyl-pentapeptide-transferase [Eubacterium limosum]|uniref:phospho-N-acetylmuramoyl-pentapeptide- transferase n=1 Tax=Eubacterium limosum TaxID=1736 RepID=UPI0010631FEB|nr:phospho-N-acetylmuramoyl-pentapeptide-transferase [Eubacterium limosum]